MDKEKKSIEMKDKHVVIQENIDLTNREKNKPLFQCKSINNVEEVKKVSHYVPQFYWFYSAVAAFFNLFLCLLMASFSDTNGFILFVVVQVIVMIIYKINLESLAASYFNSMKKKGKIVFESQLEFFDDYLVQKSRNKNTFTTCQVPYLDASRCIETSTNFYLDFGDLFVKIQKSQCDSKLIDFLHKKFEKIETHLQDNKSSEEVERSRDYLRIKRVMFVLFILTLASLFGAFFLYVWLCMKNYSHGNIFKDAWIFWCFLVIPVISILLGFKFKREGCSYNKNIIGGFIICFVLVILALPSVSYEDLDYHSELGDYQEFVGFRLPDRGSLGTGGAFKVDGDKTEYSIVSVDYSVRDGKKLTEKIRKNDNWMLSTKLSSKLKPLISSIFLFDEDSYLSVYNKTTKEYNTVPEDSGDYEIYLMCYDIIGRHLEIHKFRYSY